MCEWSGALRVVWSSEMSATRMRAGVVQQEPLVPRIDVGFVNFSSGYSY